MTQNKLSRLSINNAREYQIEYMRTPEKTYEYRVRRGARGTWSPWNISYDVTLLLSDCGFTSGKPTLLHDFYIECHIGRGSVVLNDRMVFNLMQDLNTELGRYLYSRVTRVNDNEWTLAVNSLNTDEAYTYIYKLIKRNL